jgi:hypothetical protein
MTRVPALVFAVLVLVLGLAGSAAAKPVTVADLLAGSPAEDWRVPDP